MSYIRLEDVKLIHAFSGAVEDNGGSCAQPELFVSSGILGQGARLAQILELLRDCDLLHWFLELGEEISFIPGIIAWLRMLLVPNIGPWGGIVLQAYGYLRDPEAFVATNSLDFGLGAFYPLQATLFTHAGKGHDKKTHSCYNTWLGMMFGLGWAAAALVAAPRRLRLKNALNQPTELVSPRQRKLRLGMGLSLKCT